MVAQVRISVRIIDAEVTGWRGLSIKISKYCHTVTQSQEIFLVPAQLAVTKSRLVGLDGLLVRR